MEPKPLASLSGNLLARKGAARPAMRRPQMGSLINPVLPVSVQDDLGWNDMGDDASTAPPLTMVSNDASAQPAAPKVAPTPSAPIPPVVQQQENLEHKLAAETVAAAPVIAPAKKLTPSPAKVAPKAAARVKARASKAAFTLRLDPDRHLLLRLACAVGNRSAQQIVTDALDAFLDSQPQLEVLAKQVPSPEGAARKNN